MTPRHRPRYLVPAAGVLALLVAFVVGLVVHSGATTVDDTRVLDEFIENRSPLLTPGMTAVTTVFSPVGTIVVSVVVAALAWWRSRSWGDAAFVIGSVGLSAVITFGLKLVFQRGRPPAVDQLISEVDFSFPSGHTTGIAALAFATAWIVAPRVRTRPARVLVWLVAAAAVAIVAGSRLYLGVHWFTDTLAGACIGAGTAMLLAEVLPDRSGRLSVPWRGHAIDWRGTRAAHT